MVEELREKEVLVADWKSAGRIEKQARLVDLFYQQSLQLNEIDARFFFKKESRGVQSVFTPF